MGEVTKRDAKPAQQPLKASFQLSSEPMLTLEIISRFIYAKAMDDLKVHEDTVFSYDRCKAFF